MASLNRLEAPFLHVALNPKRAGLFGPISQPGGGFPLQDLGNQLTKYQVCGTSG